MVVILLSVTSVFFLLINLYDQELSLVYKYIILYQIPVSFSLLELFFNEILNFFIITITLRPKTGHKYIERQYFLYETNGIQMYNDLKIT